jgi:predicted PurR-regulated permease PerM
MLRAIEGAGILLLLSVFFAYILAPLIPPVRRRVRIGHRNRPISDAAAILLIYAVALTPAVLTWRRLEPVLRHWVTVTAPASVDKLFARGPIVPLANLLSRAPLPAPVRQTLVTGSARVATSLERHTRATLAELIEAARYARWLAVTPIVAFLLLSGAPAFQRSALRVLPRGHLKWRVEEYLRDVNSALAGYVRAQSSAGLIVGLECVAGFLLIGTPSAVSLGVVAGILELVPALGPLTAFLITTAQSDRVIAVTIFFVALRVVQDYVIYPRLVRRGMHLSTLAVIVTVWTGAVLAGAAGVVLAIPIAGCVSVSLRHWREYREIERVLAEVRTATGAAGQDVV